ncbi:ATP-binding protein [Cryobacterium sp. Y11]|uniref:ATP-binding protein n=1 Tax=Cryobacterium sp. Y11 TaxID=2045016 RepID=UPI0018EAA702|nr:ATP-binding protein [Cryobacterium sp. Y11]
MSDPSFRSERSNRSGRPQPDKRMLTARNSAALSGFDRSLIELQLLHLYQTIIKLMQYPRAHEDAEMNEIDLALEAIFSGKATADEVESATLDFKRPQDSPKDTANDMVDAAACFANADGGIVIVGVADRVHGPDAFVGTVLGALELRNRIHQVTEPKLDVRVEERIYRGARLLEIHVQEGLDVFASRGKVPSRRFGDTCLPMTTADISRLHQERQGGDWSATDTGRVSTDADPDAIRRVRTLLRGLGDEGLRGIADAPVEDILSGLALVSSSGTLTHGGELLLCVDQGGRERELISYQHRQSMGGEVNAGKRWTGPLLSAFLDCLAAMEARVVTTPINLASGQQIQVQDYPSAALREALANAVMHGDHRMKMPITVEHSPESLEVRSPGPLVAGVSPANILTHPPKPRFPALADVMRSLGLAEKWGQGVDRMYREMIRSGKSVPAIEVHEGIEPETSITFLGGPPNDRITKYIAELPSQVQDNTDVLLIMSLLARKRTINAAKLSPIIQRDLLRTQQVLHRLATGEIELIEPTTRTVRRINPDYKLRSSALAALGPALAYQSSPRADRDRKILEHIREYSTINNGAIQRMFDMDVFNARNVIQDLVGREILVRISDQTRGPGVKYGPGPKFPEHKKSRPRTSQ